MCVQYVCVYVCVIFSLLQKTCRMDKPKIIKEIDYLGGVGTGEGLGERVELPSIHFLNRFDFWN